MDRIWSTLPSLYHSCIIILVAPWYNYLFKFDCYLLEYLSPAFSILIYMSYSNSTYLSNTPSNLIRGYERLNCILVIFLSTKNYVTNLRERSICPMYHSRTLFDFLIDIFLILSCSFLFVSLITNNELFFLSPFG